ncbi:MAG TPA: glycosyl hydrolase 115 family protein [Puia sp.]|nr:glycosyl hydrolase 115 family protein [Puia sp.]
MKRLLLFLLIALPAATAHSQDMISGQWSADDFPIFSNGSGVVPIYIDPKDHWLVGKAATLLQEDIRRVTGFTPVLITDLSNAPRIPNLIIIGSLDRSATIQRLARSNFIPASLSGKWESYVLKTVRKPMAGVGRALIIAGSDRRGTAYGVFELSRQMGVSPWYWWADVPVQHKSPLFFHGGKIFEFGPPAVKYRGFFINDEAPALSGWVHDRYGGFNHLFYEKVFELLLRLKANYLWPAMWGSAFNADDPQNPILASDYGIVMGTSHHEPMLRSQQEWKRFGTGPWNYQTNAAALDSFWKKGIENMDSHESIVTVGMRGDGDKPMEEHSNIELLEKIVADQRAIISNVTGKQPSATPQSWALYKEVQDYYDRGMRVPDDVTLLLCDDNWGNVRKLPRPIDSPRGGGYGMYYHFDYVGGPRNYKWLNTNPIARVWEEMHLTKAYGDDRIWIVNVGDIKPMEFPISFFLDYAWDPDRWPASRLPDYTRQWTTEQFGRRFADSIAYILTQYARFNGRRKPELLSPDTYSLLNYREADNVVAAYNRLAAQAESIGRRLPAESRDAYFELVLYPVLACANLNELYVTAARNKLYAAQGRAATDSLANRVKVLFDRDSILSMQFNKETAEGKWNHMMDQTHIGYTYWQEPPHNNIPATTTLDPAANTGFSWGVAIEGSASWWPAANDAAKAVLPSFSPYQNTDRYIDVFNRSVHPVTYTIQPGAPWIIPGPADKQVDKEERIRINIDWARAPSGHQQAPVTIIGPDGVKVTVIVSIDNPANAKPGRFKGFIEANNYVSIEAQHYTSATGGKDIRWQIIPDLGRTLSGVEALPVTAPAQTPGATGAHLEYQLYLFDTGAVKVYAYFSPILAFNRQPVRYAVSFDDEQPQLVDLTTGNESPGAWDKMVADNIRISVSTHLISRPGMHVLKYWLVDPGPVLQKIVIDNGAVQPSYLGPPESPTAH